MIKIPTKRRFSYKINVTGEGKLFETNKQKLATQKYNQIKTKNPQKITVMWHGDQMVEINFPKNFELV